MITDSYFLIPTVIAQLFNPIAEFAMPTGTPTNNCILDMLCVMDLSSILLNTSCGIYSIAIKSK